LELLPDIIRAEADKLNFKTGQMDPGLSLPTWFIKRNPSVAGTVASAAANPQTAASLLQLAAAIARDRHYELECLQVILVPRHSSPSETQVSTAKVAVCCVRLKFYRKWKIPVHTQIRVTHDLAQAMLETINERHIDLILMGWKGNTITPVGFLAVL